MCINKSSKYSIHDKDDLPVVLVEYRYNLNF